MRRLLPLLCLLPVLALAKPSQVSVSRDLLEEAGEAMANGDFAQAADLAQRDGGPEALRLLGEAKEAQGDRLGASKAYAQAAAAGAAGASFLTQRAQSLKDSAVPVAKPSPSAVPTLTFSATATLAPTSQPTATTTATQTVIAATATSTVTPNSQPSLSPSAATSPLASASPVTDEAAQLAKERAELEAEKAALAQERERLKQDQASKAASPTQGLTFYLGAGGYWAKAVERLNDLVSQDNQGNQGGNGPSSEIHFPVNMAAGLRWEGFAIEGEVLDGSLSYNKVSGGKTVPSTAKVNLTMLSFGYDWAFIHRDGLLGPVELAIPLRLEFGQADVNVGSQDYQSGIGGPAFGLSLRCWATHRLMLEAQALYHVNVSGGDKGDGGNNNGNGGGNGSGGNSSQSNGPGGLSQDGFEARLNLGWRFF